MITGRLGALYNRAVRLPVLVNWELLRRRARHRLAQQPGWIVAGVLGPLAISCWAILTPFDIRAEYNDFRRAAIVLCACYVTFAAVYAIQHWLRPASDNEDEELKLAPLSALQFFLHRSADLCALPLFCMLLTLPLYGVLLLYVGDPYSSGSADTWFFNWSHGYWEAAGTNPWSWRVFFISLDLLAATLLPLSLAVLLNETVGWRLLRVLLLIALPAGLWFAVERAQYDYFRMCYKQTRGHDPWPYAGVFLILLLLPFILGFFKARGRVLFGLLLAALLLFGAALPFLTNDAPGGLIDVPAIGRVMGDLRYALAYFAGHLSLDKNIGLLLDRYQSAVLTTDITAGNLIPQRVAIWVGAGLYPPLIAVMSFVMLGLGLALRKRHPTE